MIKCNTTLPYISVNSGVGKYKYTLQRAQQLWRRPRVCCTYVHDISRQNSKLYSINHLIIFQSHLCKHTPYDLPTEMKSRKEINKQYYQRNKDSIKEINKQYYQRNKDSIKAKRKIRYSPAKRKLEYIRQKSASAQKVANEQFCNRTTRSTSKCDQKSMQVEGKVDARDSRRDSDSPQTNTWAPLSQRQVKTQPPALRALLS